MVVVKKASSSLRCSDIALDKDIVPRDAAADDNDDNDGDRERESVCVCSRMTVW